MKKRLKKILIINILLIFFDFLTKQLIKHYFYKIPFFKIKIIDNFFNIVLVENKGIAFGFLRELKGNLKNIFLIYLPLVIVIIILIYLTYVKKISKLSFWGLNLIISGAIGNLIDRYFYGYVIDFIDLYYKNFHWPAFNLADTYITIGAFLLIFDALFSKRRNN